MQIHVTTSQRHNVAMIRLVLLLSLATTGVFCTVVGRSDITTLESVNGYPMDDLSKCRYSFLDIGSNIGVHSRFLYEPDLYVNSKYEKKIFSQFFPDDRTSSSICAFLFEPNPNHLERMKELEKHHHIKGRYVRSFNVGLANYTATTSFYNGQSKGGAGFSAVARHVSQPLMEVSVVDIRHALRQLTSLGLQSEVVLLKVDVEGYEYILLRSLITSGLMCSVVTHLTVEFHLRKIKCHPDGVNCKGLSRSMVMWLQYLSSDPQCSLQFFSVLDDESYVYDGMPLVTE